MQSIEDYVEHQNAIGRNTKGVKKILTSYEAFKKNPYKIEKAETPKATEPKATEPKATEETTEKKGFLGKKK